MPKSCRKPYPVQVPGDGSVCQKKEQRCGFENEAYKTYVRILARQNRTPDVHIFPALISSIHKQLEKHCFI